jgi:hypothetical protein
MEDELKAVLLRSKKVPKKLIKYFPLDKGDTFKEQLLIISNKIKSYGSGYLQNKDLVYYYKTFTYQESNIQLFCVIFYHFSLNRKYVLKLAEDIYKLTDSKNLFKNNDINEKITSEINNLFFKYISLIKQEKGVMEFCSGIENIVFETSSDECECKSTLGIKSRSRVINKRIKRENSDLGNTFNNTIFTEMELTFLINGYNLYKIVIVNKWKKTKIIWLVIFIILSVLLYIFLGFFIYFNI